MKKGKKEKTNQVAASSRFALVRRRCGGHGSVKKRGTARGGPLCTCKRKMVSGAENDKERKKEGGRGCVTE